jgi:hypothetical protein
MALKRQDGNIKMALKQEDNIKMALKEIGG